MKESLKVQVDKDIWNRTNEVVVTLHSSSDSGKILGHKARILRGRNLV